MCIIAVYRLSMKWARKMCRRGACHNAKNWSKWLMTLLFHYNWPINFHSSWNWYSQQRSIATYLLPCFTHFRSSLIHISCCVLSSLHDSTSSTWKTLVMSRKCSKECPKAKPPKTWNLKVRLGESAGLTLVILKGGWSKRSGCSCWRVV